jgi:hypothetical protein
MRTAVLLQFRLGHLQFSSQLGNDFLQSFD